MFAMDMVVKAGPRGPVSHRLARRKRAGEVGRRDGNLMFWAGGRGCVSCSDSFLRDPDALYT